MACEIGVRNGSASFEPLTQRLVQSLAPELPGFTIEKAALWQKWAGPGSHDPMINYVRFVTIYTDRRLTNWDCPLFLVQIRQLIYNCPASPALSGSELASPIKLGNSNFSAIPHIPSILEK